MILLNKRTPSGEFLLFLESWGGEGEVREDAGDEQKKKKEMQEKLKIWLSAGLRNKPPIISCQKYTIST